MYAVIATGGKQYRVELGDIIFIEKLDVAEGTDVGFDTLMVADGENMQVGTPLLETKVQGKVLAHGRGQKIIIFKYKAKKNYRKKTGHRQPFTKVQIMTIGENVYKPDPNAVPAARPEKKVKATVAPKAPAAAAPKAGTKPAATKAAATTKKPAAKTADAAKPAAKTTAAKTTAAKPATKTATAAKPAAAKPAAPKKPAEKKDAE